MPQDTEENNNGLNNEQSQPVGAPAQPQNAQANPNLDSLSPEPTTASEAPQTATPAAAAPAATPQTDRPFYSPPAAASGAAAPAAAGKSHGSKAKYFHLAVHAVLLIVLLVTAFQFFKAEGEKSELQAQVVALQNNPLLVAERKTQNTIERVSRLATLPSNETPTVSEVSDAEAVKKSIVGLTDVQNGDNLLFYFQGGKFIQYRPSTDKIILNQPLNVK